MSKSKQHLNTEKEKSTPLTAVQFPPELTALDQWITWNRENGEKIPYNPRTQGKQYGDYKSNPETWAPFSKLKFKNKGFVLRENETYVTCIDLDNCLNEDGSLRDDLKPGAQWIIDHAPKTFIEKSISGRGLHIWLLGTLPSNILKKEHEGFEVYSKSQFIVTTGISFNGSVFKLADGQPLLDELRTMYSSKLDESAPSGDTKPITRRDNPIEYGNVAAALNALSVERASDYQGGAWLDIGMILHHTFAGGDEGLLLWVDFSRRCLEKFKEGECEEKWETFKSNRENSLTRKTLFEWAKKDTDGRFVILYDSTLENPLLSNEPVSDRFKVISLEQILQPKPPIDWLVEGFIPEKSSTIVAADGGSGKTWLSVYLALAVAFGKPFLGYPTVKSPVLYIDNEMGSPWFDYRVEALMKGMGLVHGIEDVKLGVLPQTGLLLSEPDHVNALQLAIMQGGYKLVITDTLSKVSAGVDQNSTNEMQTIFNTINTLKNLTGAAFYINHHTNRAGEYRNSTVIQNDVDTMLKLKGKPKDGPIELLSEKTRNINFPKKTLNLSIAMDDYVPVEASFTVVTSKKDLGMSRSADVILKYLDKGPMSLTDIMKRAKCTEGTARNRMSELAKQGYVENIGGSGKGKSARYKLTESGREALDSLKTGSFDDAADDNDELL